MENSYVEPKEGDEWKKRAPQCMTVGIGGKSYLGEEESPDMLNQEVKIRTCIAKGLTLQHQVRVDPNEETLLCGFILQMFPCSGFRLVDGPYQRRPKPIPKDP